MENNKNVKVNAVNAVRKMDVFILSGKGNAVCWSTWKEKVEDQKTYSAVNNALAGLDALNELLANIDGMVNPKVKKGEPKPEIKPILFNVWCTSFANVIMNGTYKSWIQTGVMRDGTPIPLEELIAWKTFADLYAKTMLHVNILDSKEAVYTNPKFDREGNEKRKKHRTLAWDLLNSMNAEKSMKEDFEMSSDIPF